MLRPAIVALMLSAALAACGAPDSFGPAEHLGRAYHDGYVTTESRYGGDTVSGAVRRAGNGHYEVQLPGGTWVDCHLSCSNTLRRDTVDFWQNHGGPMTGQDGPGYFIWTR